MPAGEAEAIVLATVINADLIILDEKLGRFHARHADLKVTGSIGVLIKAKSEGLIAELKSLLNILVDNDFWMSDIWIHQILRSVGEL